jgi:regulator of sirC expression with transglutaminase-like and TPR domain
MLTLDQIKQQLHDGGSKEDAIKQLSIYIADNPNDDEALTVRGLQYWGLGNRSAAIGDYLAAVKLNPNSKASLALKATYEILDFYNKDLYNP